MGYQGSFFKNNYKATEIKKSSEDTDGATDYRDIAKNGNEPFMQMIIIFIKKKVEKFMVSLKLYFQIHLFANKTFLSH